MRLSVIAVFLAVLGLSAAFQSAPAQAQSKSIAGTWQQVDEDTGEVQSHILISEKNGVFEGKVIKFFPGPGEPENPICTGCSGARKNQPIVGMVVIERMRKGAEGYEGGLIIDPDSGTEYKGKMALSEDGQVLKVRGFVGVSLFGRTQEWKRLN